MARQHIHKKIERTPEELAELKAIRERIQKERPTQADLAAQGAQFTTLGEVMQLRQVVFALKQERERQGLTLAQLAERTGIDPAPLSRLETGKTLNPTWGTLQRIAAALGKEIVCELRDAASVAG